MDEVRVSNWGELNEELFEGAWNEGLGRSRANHVFRGMGRSTCDLSTSLTRLGGDFAAHEGHLLRNFRKYAHRDAVGVDSAWHWLALAQHHGLPTRLLDWSFSPFVALHMATENPGWFDEDGVVWRLDYLLTNQKLPKPLQDVLKEEGGDVFTAEMLDRAARNLQDLERFDEDDYVLLLEPPSIDERIVNQFALFSLMSRATARLDVWLDRRRGLAKRIILPASLKGEIRDKLDQANITERVLMPGLDGLCRWLKRYYSPFPGKPVQSGSELPDPRPHGNQRVSSKTLGSRAAKVPPEPRTANGRPSRTAARREPPPPKG